MINLVFVMPCLVAALTFLKLFLHGMMYQLNFLYELPCLINVTVTTDGDIFLKDEVQWRSWKVPITCLKWRCICGRMFCPFVCMLHVMQLFIPQFGMFATISSKNMNNYFIDHLGLSIYLWMKGCTLLQLCFHHVPQI